MKKLTLLLLGLSCVFCISCSERHAGALDPPLGTGENLSLSGVNQEIIVVRSEEEMVDSVLAGLLELVDDDPYYLRLVAQTRVKAMLAERFLLSEYEIPFIPQEQDPEFGYMTYRTESGTWYFALPHDLCGTAIPEAKYNLHTGDIIYLCGGSKD